MGASFTIIQDIKPKALKGLLKSSNLSSTRKIQTLYLSLFAKRASRGFVLLGHLINQLIQLYLKTNKNPSAGRITELAGFLAPCLHPVLLFSDGSLIRSFVRYVPPRSRRPRQACPAGPRPVVGIADNGRPREYYHGPRVPKAKV